MMTYEEYGQRGFFYADYKRLSQWQRLRGLLQAWKRNGRIGFCALWDADDFESDWVRVDGWWKPSRWYLWKFGIDQCQNFHRINLGPMAMLIDA